MNCQFRLCSTCSVPFQLPGFSAGHYHVPPLAGCWLIIGYQGQPAHVRPSENRV